MSTPEEIYKPFLRAELVGPYERTAADVPITEELLEDPFLKVFWEDLDTQEMLLISKNKMTFRTYRKRFKNEVVEEKESGNGNKG